MLAIDPERCDLCGLCRKACPFGAMVLVEGRVAPDERCTLCGACVNACPRAAVAIARRKASAEELAAYRGVFVWAELEGAAGKAAVPRRVVYELLGCGRGLADRLGEPLVAVALGDAAMTGLEELCRCGADRVIACRHELLGSYSTDGFTTALAAVVAKEKPAVLLFGATANGRDLAPRTAARLRFGLTADCTALAIDDERRLVQTRPAFGGNIMASIVAPATRPQAATVRPNLFAPAAPDPARPVVIEEFPVRLARGAIRTRVIERIETPVEGGRIEQARVIVAAGRGLSAPENLALVRRLAGRLGGALAGSRAIVEAGWIPPSLQVGQSGTTVSPELYLAVGIHGAVQHVVGMRTARRIVAINRDPEAPIFKIADLGVVGDALAILPRLLEALAENPDAAPPSDDKTAPAV